MPEPQKHPTSYEGWIEDLAYELADEYAMHGDGEPRAHSVLEDAVLGQLGPVRDEQHGEVGVPVYLWDDPDPAGRTRVLLYALYESLWPWSRHNGFPERTLIVEADDRWHAHVVAVSGRKGGERFVVFSDDVDLRALICRNDEDLRALYGRLRDQVEGKDLPGALRGRREQLSYAPVFGWTDARSVEPGARPIGAPTLYHLCEDCAADRAVNAHEPVQKVGVPTAGNDLVVCEDCGSVNAVECPEGKLPVLVGRYGGPGQTGSQGVSAGASRIGVRGETVTHRVEFPMVVDSNEAQNIGRETGGRSRKRPDRESATSPHATVLKNELDLLRWARNEFEDFRISFV